MKMLKKNEGFTLIELMIVVVIIGVLAAVAVPQFLKYQLKAKTSESTRMVGGIKTATESFFSKYKCQNAVVAGCYPQAQESGAFQPASKVAWVPSDGLQLIGFTASGTVYFSYSVNNYTIFNDTLDAAGASCGTATGTVDSTINIVNGEPVVIDGLTPAVAPANTIDWMARGDVDGDGLTACYIMGNRNNEFLNNPPDASDNVF